MCVCPGSIQHDLIGRNKRTWGLKWAEVRRSGNLRSTSYKLVFFELEVNSAPHWGTSPQSKIKHETVPQDSCQLNLPSSQIQRR